MQSPLHNLKLLKLKFCEELLGKKPRLSSQGCQPHVLGLSLREANGRRRLSTAEPPPQEPASRVEELHLCQEIWRLCGSLGDSWPHLDTCILHGKLEEKACVLGPTHSPGEALHWAQHQWEMGVSIERLPLQGASLHDHISHKGGPDPGPLASWLSTPESKANFTQSSRKNWANLGSLPLLQTKTQCSIRRPVTQQEGDKSIRDRAMALCHHHRVEGSMSSKKESAYLIPEFCHSVMSDSATPWTAARQASLSITISWSLLKLMSTESVMPSTHLILCHPLLLPPSIFPNIRVFSDESVLRIRWPKYWSFSLNISPFSATWLSHDAR